MNALRANMLAIQQAIAAWVRAGSGLPQGSILWEDQGAPRPSGPFVALRLGLRTSGHDWIRSSPVPLTFPDIAVSADSSTDTLTAVAHGLQTGDGPVRIEATAVPAGLATGTDYWAIRTGPDTFQLAASFADAIALSPLEFFGAGSGVEVVDTLETERAGAEVEHVVEGERIGVLTIQAYGGLAGAAVGTAAPVAMLDAVLTARRLPSVNAALRAANIGVGRIDEIRPLSFPTATVASEPRAIVTVLLHLRSAIAELGTYIASAEIAFGAEFGGGSLVVPPVPPPALAPPAAVWLGQSNNEGQAHTDDLADVSLIPAYPAVSLWDWSADVSPYAVKYDTGPAPLAPRAFAAPTPNMGAELSAARVIGAYFPSSAIAKVSIGNTSLAVHWPVGGTYPAPGAGNLYNFMMQRARDLESALGVQIKLFCVGQGEADAAVQAYADAYQTNGLAIVDGIRAEWPDSVIVWWRLNAASTAPYASTVRAAQAAIAAARANVYVMDLDDVVNNLHYVSDQFDVIGDRLGIYHLNAYGQRLPLDPFWSSAPTGLSVQFTDESADPNMISSGIVDWDWDFGDGATSTLQNPTHTYADDGTYTVTLMVTGAGGGTATYSDDITVATPTWYVDATSAKSWPKGAAEHTSFIAGNGLGLIGWEVPDSQHILDEPAGTTAGTLLDDAIGPYDLTPNGLPVYGAALPGWAKTGLGFNQGSAQRAQNTGAAADFSTDDWLIEILLSLGTLDAIVRGVAACGPNVSDTGLTAMNFGTGNQLRIRGLAQLLTTPLTEVYGAAPFPVFMQTLHATPGPAVRRLVTPLGILTPTYGAGTSSTLLGLGAIGGGTSANCVVGGMNMWRGAKARRTTAEMKSWWIAKGFSVAW